MKIRSFVLICISTFLVPLIWVEGLRAQNVSTNVELSSSDVPVEKPSEIKMSLEQKVGQLFLFGFSEKTVTPEFTQFLNRTHPGGFIVFGRNIQSPSQISSLLYNLQRHATKTKQTPYFLAVDQEGGTVTRIKSFPFPPSSMAIGNTKNTSYALAVGRAIGKMLRTIGFNMNLAPVLDLASADENSFIGTRAFGRDPELVSTMGGAISEGLTSQNIIPTGKHFPGHGLISSDSHLTLPSRDISLETLLETDLKPFELLHDKLAALMVAHIAFPQIDPSGLPATYSQILLTKVLRERIGFKGLIVTDDIEMAGAQQVGSISKRAIRAIEAGADIVMIGWNRHEQMAAVNAVTEAVKTGRIPMERIDSSLARILRAKKQFGIFETPTLAPVAAIQKSLFDPSFKALVDKIVLENINESTRSMKIHVKATNPFVVMSISPDFFTAFKDSMKSTSSRYFRLSREKTKLELERVFELYPNSYVVYYVTGSSSAQILRRISAQFHKRMIVVNTLTPSSIQTSEPYFIELNTFTKHIEMGRFVADELQKHSLDETVTDDGRVPADESGPDNRPIEGSKELDPKVDD